MIDDHANVFTQEHLLVNMLYKIEKNRNTALFRKTKQHGYFESKITLNFNLSD